MAEATYLDGIRQAIQEEMRRDPNVILLGEDVGTFGGAFKVTAGILDEFPGRVLDTPIAEEGFVGMAIGAAFMGFRPIVEMQFIDFIACAFNQITNFAAKCRYRWGQGVPIVIRGPGGGGVSGGPYHSQNVEAYFVPTPGLKVVAPATAADAKGLMKAAIRDEDPVLYLEHKYLYRRMKDELAEGNAAIVPIGKAAVRREGTDLTILTYGGTLHTCLEAAEDLAAEGVSAEVVDLRSLVPLDEDAIVASVKKTSKAMVVHEDTRTGGFAGEVIARINENAFDDLDGPVLRVTAPDSPIPYSPPLEKAYLPGKDDVLATARYLAAY